jgi:hypothetical protein
MIERVLAHESQGASFAAVRASAPDASPALAAAVRALADADGDGPDATRPDDVAAYLAMFASAVEAFYAVQEPPPDALCDVAPDCRAARCEVDARRGALRVFAVELAPAAERDEMSYSSGEAREGRTVLRETDDTAAFAASLMRPRGGGATPAAEALATAFKAARQAHRRDAAAAALSSAPAGTLAYGTIVAVAPPRNGDAGGWRVSLEPDGIAALLPREETLADEALAIGCGLLRCAFVAFSLARAYR